jgi:hypothetical protein
MSDNDLGPDSLEQRRQQLTEEIRKHAAGARSERLHPVRVSHAVGCGNALSQLKELLRHGDWDQWVEEQCALSRATANRYMRLASHADRLTRYMTIREAYIAAGIINPRPGAPSSRQFGRDALPTILDDRLCLPARNALKRFEEIVEREPVGEIIEERLNGKTSAAKNRSASQDSRMRDHESTRRGLDLSYSAHN